MNAATIRINLLRPRLELADYSAGDGVECLPSLSRPMRTSILATRTSSECKSSLVAMRSSSRVNRVDKYHAAPTMVTMIGQESRSVCSTPQVCPRPAGLQQIAEYTRENPGNLDDSALVVPSQCETPGVDSERLNARSGETVPKKSSKNQPTGKGSETNRYAEAFLGSVLKPAKKKTLVEFLHEQSEANSRTGILTSAGTQLEHIKQQLAKAGADEESQLLLRVAGLAQTLAHVIKLELEAPPLGEERKQLEGALKTAANKIRHTSGCKDKSVPGLHDHNRVAREMRDHIAAMLEYVLATPENTVTFKDLVDWALGTDYSDRLFKRYTSEPMKARKDNLASVAREEIRAACQRTSLSAPDDRLRVATRIIQAWLVADGKSPSEAKDVFRHVPNPLLSNEGQRKKGRSVESVPKSQSSRKAVR